MCRNIRTLHNFEPPTTEEEARAAALQYVRKVSGFNRPSKVNRAVFEQAVEDVTAVTLRVLDELEATTAPKNWAAEAIKARERWQKRAERMRAG